MSKKFHKFKLLLDENFPHRTRFKRLNNRYNLRHIEDDLHLSGTSDPEVYRLAEEQGRLIVTFNERDFRLLQQSSDKTGVVSVSPYLSYEEIDTKLAALLLRSTPNSLFGKFTVISGES